MNNTFPQVILIDVNPPITAAWQRYFSHEKEGVEIVTLDFESFMKARGTEVDAVVSPGNSYGLMDGGYDLAIRDYFGESLQEVVQNYIVEHYFGEQMPGTAFSVPIPKTQDSMLISDKILIHVPTMQFPAPIKDERIVYHCMRAALMEAVKKEVKKVLIPAFGGLTGAINADILALHMWAAYVQIRTQLSRPYKVNGWEVAVDFADKKMWRMW